MLVLSSFHQTKRQVLGVGLGFPEAMMARSFFRDFKNNLYYTGREVS